MSWLPRIRAAPALLTLLALALGTGLLPSRAADPGSAAAQEGYRISIDQVLLSEQQDQVAALVSVFDPAGRPVPSITQFDALIDGTRVPVESAASVVNRQTGISVLLLIDISGSMQGEPLAQARAAASTFVQGLLPQDVVATMTFAGGVSLVSDYTPDRTATLATISGLVTEPGGTALYQAIKEGVDAVARAPTSGSVIVLLTDGRDSGASQIGREDAVQAAAAGGIPIYTIGLGTDIDTDILQGIAFATNGSYHQAPAPADLGPIFDTISSRLRSQYQVVVRVPKATISERVLALETRVGNVTLHAQHSFTTSPAVVEPKGGGGPPPWWIWVAAGAFALPILALVLRRFRRPRRHAKSPVAGGPSSELALPARAQPSPRERGALTGRLTVIDGPSVGESALVSMAPINIGTGPDSELRLEPAESVAGRHARVWLQHDRLIVHLLAAKLQGSVSGAPAEWTSLEPNETLQIGPNVLRFSLESTGQDPG